MPETPESVNPMPLDPNIALSVKTPEPASPLTTIGGLMQVRDMGSQIALRNAQTQQSQQQAQDIAMQSQQRARDLQSYNTVRDLLRDPDVQKQVTGGDFSPIFNAGVTPGVADSVIKNLQGMQTTAQSLAKGKAEFYASGRAALAAGLEGLHPTDDAAAAEQYNQFRTTLAAEHPELAQRLPTLAPGQNFRDQIKDLAASNGVARMILENQAALESKQAETAAKTTEAGLSAAKTPGAAAESEKAQLVTNAMKSFLANPQSGTQIIDGVLPASLDPAANASYKATLQSVMGLSGPEAAAHVIESAAQHASALQQQLNPQTRAAKIADTVATERATAPIKTAQAISTETALAPLKLQQAVAQARAMMGNGPTSNVPPHLAVPAINAFEKAGQEYVTALGAADEMQSIIDLARAGNKVAYAYAPVTGVLTINTANGVKRVNMPEIESYGGAGSAMDKIKGWLGKQATGASIPADVLNNMDTLHAQLAANSGDTYARKVQVVNGSFGSSFAPLQLKQAATNTAPAAGAVAPMPATLSAADVGKVYLSKTGQKLKITAVNPANPKQFQSQTVQ